MTFYRFTPDMVDPQILKQSSVGRESIISDLVNRIKEHAQKNVPIHIIFIGQRGIGKTHLLLLLYYNLIENKSLLKIIKPIKLSEDEYSVVKLSDLFYRILEEADVPVNEEDSGEFVIQKARDFFKKKEKENIMLVVLIDNIHLIFQQFPDLDIKKLRSVLQEQKNIMIIGTAPSVFGELTNYEHPFYNFFELNFLKELTESEIKTFIMKKLKLEKKEEILNHFEEYSKKIEAISVLTGGNPRLIISLCEILCKPDKLIQIEDALLTLLDGLTPYYQAKMEMLSKQQRKVFDTLATSERPLSPTEISKITEYPVTIVNVQLKRLEEAGYVETIKLRKKKSVKYEVRERLFRIWREMRFSLGKRKISLLVKFLEVWYSKEELLEEYSRLLSEIGKQKSDVLRSTQLIDHLWYIQEAVGAPKKYQLLITRLWQFLQTDSKKLFQKELEALKEIGKTDFRAKSMYYSFRSMSNIFAGKTDKALEDSKMAIDTDQDNLFANSVMALNLFFADKYEDSLKFSRKLTKIGGKRVALLLEAMNLIETNDTDKALELSDELIKISPETVGGWITKGDILVKQKDPKAITIYEKALELSPDTFYILKKRALAAVEFNDNESEKMIDELLIDHPEDLRINLAKVELLIKRAEYIEAKNVLEKCLKITEELNESMFHELLDIYFGYCWFLTNDFVKNEKLEDAKKIFISTFSLNEKLGMKEFTNRLLDGFILFCRNKNFSFIPLAYQLVEKSLGNNDLQVIFPIKQAAEYILTENVDILENLQKEERQVVVEIVKENSPKTYIPKNLKI